MKSKFELAKKGNIKKIYSLWTKTGKRIFGLGDSINNKNVWIFRCGSEIIGFCRYNTDEGIKLDYLKFYEIKIEHNDKNTIKVFFDHIDDIILKLGYYKAEVFATDKDMISKLIDANWSIKQNKFSFANEKIYSNFIFEKDLSNKINDCKIIDKKFGKLINN